MPQPDVEDAADRQPWRPPTRRLEADSAFDCGSLDPWLNDQTRVVERKRYKELGRRITVLVA